MAGFKRFEDIKAWQSARELAVRINRLCETGPPSRNFEFRRQITGAAMSAMSNIAEGLGRHSDKDFAHFLDIARGSAMEVQSLLYVALDLGYMSESDFSVLYDLAYSTAAMIGSLAIYLRQHPR